MEYKCINKECSEYDPDSFENCSGYGIRWDGNLCNKAIVIGENDEEFEES